MDPRLYFTASLISTRLPSKLPLKGRDLLALTDVFILNAVAIDIDSNLLSSLVKSIILGFITILPILQLQVLQGYRTADVEQANPIPFLHYLSFVQMPDPLSTSAGAAGLTSLGLEVTKGLIQYYESWKDSHDNVATMLESLEALFNTLKLLNEKILVTQVISRQSVDRFAESVILCASAIQRLKEKLQKAQSTKPGLNASIRRAQYPFREKTLAKMHNTVSDLRSNLSLALDALHFETITTSLQKLELMSGKVNATNERAAKREASELLEWLTPLTFQEKQSDVLCKRHAGSGQWLLGNNDFLAWVNGDTRVLWCTGMRTYKGTSSNSQLI